jgi:hypothetical protein
MADAWMRGWLRGWRERLLDAERAIKRPKPAAPH